MAEKVVVYREGDLVTAFRIEINAKKTAREFIEHEKHIGFTKDGLRKAHKAIVAEWKKQNAK